MLKGEGLTFKRYEYFLNKGQNVGVKFSLNVMHLHTKTTNPNTKLLNEDFTDSWSKYIT